MTATINIGNQTTTYTATQADTTYLLNKGETISSTGDGINTAFDVSGRAIVVGGVIDAGDTGVFDGSSSSHTIITISETGQVIGVNGGILADGFGDVITNNGMITASGFGASGIDAIASGVKITNHGVLTASTGSGIYAEGAGARIYNDGNIDARTGISVNTQSTEASRIVNVGTIDSDDSSSIRGYDGKETVVNRGTLAGDVILNSGNDVFRNIGGHVNGIVYGGDDNDRYYVDSAKIRLSEDSTGGLDKVYSSASWTLGANFEEATLTGKANVKLTGNELANHLTGNAGNNHLFGLAGGDTLSGGKGADLLTGGTDADTFVFKSHFGKDTIADFENATDHIDLSHWTGVDSFADLKAHHLAVSGDDLVIANGNDILTLQNMHKADLDASDFVF